MNLASRAAVAALLLSVGTGAGYLLAHHQAPALVPRKEAAAPAVTQADGSVILERKATALAGTVIPKATMPAGAKLERKVDLTAKPKVAGDAAHVELSLVRMPDDTRRIIAYSDDAEVGGLDLPVEQVFVPVPAKKWAVGMYMDPVHRGTYGVFVDRDLSRMRVGAEIGKSARGGAEVRLKIGLTF